MIRNAIIIDPEDNIATVLRDIAAGGDVVAGCGDEVVTFPALQDIPFGHKVAVRAVAEGETILKYGAVIGAASTGIERGAHAHVHNVVSLRGRGDLNPEQEANQ
ncbi:MAG: UxaA family hydrolase [Rhodospirillaceae bacterium]|nr:UxaA family hydrolase [Rhodospirillaceae bacterium]